MQHPSGGRPRRNPRAVQGILKSLPGPNEILALIGCHIDRGRDMSAIEQKLRN